MKKRIFPVLLSGLVVATAALGCDVATDPVTYEEFIKAEGEGEFGIWVHSGLYNRTYYLHVPANLDEGNLHPLMILLHGNGGTGEGLHQVLRADELLDSAGIITVYPDGIEGSWSVGCDECTRAEELEADDVTFLQTLSRHLAESLPIDTTQVYVAGFSQGGSAAYLFACRAANPPAGVLGVGALAFRSIAEGCTPSRPFPVVSVHGTADLLAFYGGYGFEAPLQSVPETMDMWRGVWACAENPVAGEYPDTVDDFTTVSTFTWTGCRTGGGVFHYRVNMGGHTWPGPTGPWSQVLGLHNRDLDTTREALEIFASFRSGN